MTNLAGRTALITGGSAGIGKSIALVYAQQGIHVALTYFGSKSSADEVVQEIQDNGGRAVAVFVDVRKESEIREMVAKVRQVLGRIDILVNNAGMVVRKPWQQLTTEDWHQTLSTNLTSTFLITQEIVPEMVSHSWGRIIFISSIAAQTGGVIGPHYAASKAGMIGLTHGYASVLAKTGVTVNAIAPALVKTGMLDPNLTPERIPIGRFGLPEEVADIAVLLAGNGYITGQTINVNGGVYMS